MDDALLTMRVVMGKTMRGGEDAHTGGGLQPLKFRQQSVSRRERAVVVDVVVDVVGVVDGVDAVVDVVDVDG